MSRGPENHLPHRFLSPCLPPISISVSLTVSISSSSQCVTHARTIYACNKKRKPPFFSGGAMVFFVPKIETQKDAQSEGVEVLVLERADGQVS